MTLADAAVDWEGVTPAEYELIVIGDDGLPSMPDRPELRERAEAILTALEHGKISGMVNDMYGEDIHPRYMRLDRDSVAAWVKATDAWLAEKEAAADAEPSPPLNLPMQQTRGDRLLTSAEVIAKLGFSLSTLKRKMDKLPAPIKQGTNNYWSEVEIDRYVDDLKAAREAESSEKIAADKAKEEEKHRRSEEAKARKRRGNAVIAGITRSTLKS